VRAIEKLHLYEEGTDLRAWLFTIMHNLYATKMRAAARYVVTDPVDLADHRRANVNQLATIELNEIGEALSRLPKAQRRLLLRSAFLGGDEKTYEALAVYEGVPVGAVKYRLSRGRAMLRMYYEGATLSSEEVEMLR
jgi:RNA polymerase sigma-70 factor, ECF subfamily